MADFGDFIQGMHKFWASIDMLVGGKKGGGMGWVVATAKIKK